MNNYETVFILTPVLSEAQVKEAVDKVKAALGTVKAEIVNEENWGLETQFRRDERVIRFLTFRQDKFAAEYAAKRRGLKASKERESAEKANQ